MNNPTQCDEAGVFLFATFLQGKLFRFKVGAFDEVDSIGEDEHLRAVINTELLLAGAARHKA